MATGIGNRSQTHFEAAAPGPCCPPSSGYEGVVAVYRISERAKRDAAVAASGSGPDPEAGRRLPAGEVHGWWQGQNETVCGLALSRSQLVRFPALDWTDVQPASGGYADLVQVVCPRCAQALAPRNGTGWQRTDPRP